MTPEQMDILVKLVEKETVERRNLGGYNSEATTIMVLWECVLKIVRHLQDEQQARNAVKSAKPRDRN